MCSRVKLDHCWHGDRLRCSDARTQPAGVNHGFREFNRVGCVHADAQGVMTAWFDVLQ